jgi:accessory gene regulator protein AgrB
MDINHKSTLSPINPPDDLVAKVISCIHKKSLQKVKVRFGVLVAIAVASLSSCIALSIGLWHSIVQTGFYDYLSLVLSDTSALGSFWKQLLVSLAESLPMLSFASFIAVAGVFVWSGAKVVRNAVTLKAI